MFQLHKKEEKKISKFAIAIDTFIQIVIGMIYACKL